MDWSGGIGDLMMSSNELEARLDQPWVTERSNPPPPPNSPNESENIFDFGVVNHNVSVLTNLYLSQTGPHSLLYEEEDGSAVSSADTAPAEAELAEADLPEEKNSNPQDNNMPDIEEVPVSLSDCPTLVRSPDSKVYKPLNPEAAPYIPSVPSTTSLLRAFSAPASPEYQDGLVKINPCSIDTPVTEISKVTRRRHHAAAQVPPLKFDEVEDMETSQASWWERMRVPPPPPRSGAKRARTMTTSTCGPDIEAALGSLATADYERFKQNLVRATVIKRRKYD